MVGQGGRAATAMTEIFDRALTSLRQYFQVEDLFSTPETEREMANQILWLWYFCMVMIAVFGNLSALAFVWI